MLARLLALAFVVALAGVVWVFLVPTLAIAYLRAEIADAETVAAESEALCRANRWFHSGLTPTYGVECRDAEGREVRPWEDGRYGQIAVITIKWTSGQAVERRLLSREPLGCVFGE